jgi:hypothetical protein
MALVSALLPASASIACAVGKTTRSTLRRRAAVSTSSSTGNPPLAPVPMTGDLANDPAALLDPQAVIVASHPIGGNRKGNRKDPHPRKGGGLLVSYERRILTWPKNPGYYMHFAAPSGSWLKMVEAFFSINTSPVDSCRNCCTGPGPDQETRRIRLSPVGQLAQS